MRIPTISVKMDLPFLLRLEETLTFPYEEICDEHRAEQLVGQQVQISFSRKAAPGIDKSDLPSIRHERTAVDITIESPGPTDDLVGMFAIRNCLEIVNKLIIGYQATTGEVSNSGFIFPMGTTDMQLFADIRVDGHDIRDRWPFQGGNTFPLSKDKIEELRGYVSGQESLPLATLFQTNAVLSLERGQYPIAIVQAATAVELRATLYVASKLKASGWSATDVDNYEKSTLGQKLRFATSEIRSLEAHLGAITGYLSLHTELRDWFVPLRNDVIHGGRLVSHDDCIKAVRLAGKFLKISA